MKTAAPLDRVEIDVLARIRRHREERRSLRPVQVALAVCTLALLSGWFTGHAQLHKRAIPTGSEAAVLADDVSLAPSSLLASNQ
jgi:hypothetical protein